MNDKTENDDNNELLIEMMIILKNIKSENVSNNDGLQQITIMLIKIVNDDEDDNIANIILINCSTN